MEELTESLATSFQVTSFPNNPHAPHPRFAQYKIKKTATQEERRRRLLALQKLRRHNYLHHVRGLGEGNWSGELSDEDADQDEVQKTEETEIKSLEKEENGESMDIKQDKKECTIKVKNDETEEPMELVAAIKVPKPPKSYKNQLMLSEWLVEIPEDMAANWLLMLCPVGRRSLVVTANGSTKAYTKSGYCVHQFPSYLPGGNRQQQLKSKDYTVLDTIYSETDRTFYVLDLMCWRGHPVFNSETEFRFYWLNAKLEEVPEVKQHSSLNPYRFLALPHYVCSAAEMEIAMWSPLPFSQPLDGLLFYNKETHYMHGPTPLVGWLKAYMLPELLGIKVPDSYMSERPANYVCMEQHLKTPLSKKKGHKKDQPMQTETENAELLLGEAEPTEAEPDQNPKVPGRRKKKKKKRRNKKGQPMQTDEQTDGNVCMAEPINGALTNKNIDNKEECEVPITEHNDHEEKGNTPFISKEKDGRNEEPLQCYKKLVDEHVNDICMDIHVVSHSTPTKDIIEESSLLPSEQTNA